MKTDRELLELAAKAAKLEVVTWSNCQSGGFLRSISETESGKFWNPLNDDGDALRLVATLKLCIDFMDGSVWRREHDHSLVLEYFGGDHDPCYRRAIVRAAAEIGESI